MKGKNFGSPFDAEQKAERDRMQLRIKELESENKTLRLTQKEQKKSEERYRLILKNTDDLIAVTTFTLNPVFTYISPSHKKIMGYEPEELMGKPGMNYVHPKDKMKLFPLLKKYFLAKISGIFTGKSPDISERLEYRAIGKEGQWHYLQSTVNIIKDSDEILYVSRDITEQKKAEEQHRELEARLRQSEKLEAVGTLAGGVAHDLNNILSAIVNYPELLLLDLPPDSPLLEPLNAIQKAGERAAAIVADLLSLARREPVVKETLLLNDIVWDFLKSPVCEKLKSVQRQITIREHLEQRLNLIQGSPVHLTKTLMNMVSNAAESIPGEGNIVISTRNRHVDEPLKDYDNEIPVGDYVVLAVKDNGKGIKPEDLKKIFIPFFTRKLVGQTGTGLGMTVVWGTVKDHHGYIQVESCLGSGTSIALFFPASREKRLKEKTPFSIDEYKGDGESIVIIDDIEEQRTIASQLLSHLGYSVKTAADVDEALQLVKDEPPELFILDMIMEPGLDGLDSYKKILKIFPDAKAIIASGFSETDRVKDALRLGAGQYIRKPYTMETIAKAVKQELYS